MSDAAPDFGLLLQRFADGVLSPAELVSLNDRLRTSESDRRRMLAHASMACALRDAMSLPAPGRGKVFGRGWATAGVFAAAAVLVLSFVGVVAMMIAHRSRPDAGSRVPVATLVDAANVTWGDSDVPISVGGQLPAGFIRLKSGTAKIEFFSGAQVTLTGPCAFGLNSEMRGFLRSGKLVAYVPPSAHGFTVGAPGMAVVDLGTRFTMDVEATGLNVRVLQGRINLLHEDGRLAGSLVGFGRAHFDPRTATFLIDRTAVNEPPLSYEAFDGYRVGNIDGQHHRANGYAGAWVNTDGDATAQVIEPGLEYRQGNVRLVTSGGALRTRGAVAYETTRIDFDVSAEGPFAKAGDTDRGLIGGPGVDGTLFLSFLVRATASTDDAFGAIELLAGGVPKIDFGQVYNADHFGHVMTLPTPAATAPLDSAVHLVVARFDFTAGAKAYYQFWIDPDLKGGPSQPATFSGMGDLGFNALRFRSGNEGKPWTFDEIRWGQSWPSVLPTETVSSPSAGKPRHPDHS